mgnify:CR=1 FL=1
MNKRKTLPVGLQSFRKIIEDDYLYIDKTELIYKLVNEYQYIFLSRPRRLGNILSDYEKIYGHKHVRLSQQ